MHFELQPLTDPGRRYVALAEAHVPALTERAALHDREGSFPTENLTALRDSGFLAACAPVALGGLGVELVHDFMVAISRLGRGDGSTALAATMHSFFVFVLAREWTAATTAGDTAQANELAGQLEAIARKEVLLCALATEPGTDLLHPRTTATRTDGGWLLNGRKGFATMSGAATHGNATFRLVDEQGAVQVASARLPLDRAGIEVRHNWDALGMRGTGSHDVVLADVFVPEADVTVLSPWGEYAEWYIVDNAIGNFGLIGAFLGIAESARDCAVGLATSRRTSSGRLQAESYAVQHTIAEIEIDLATSRAMLARAAVTFDAFLAAHPPGVASMAELHALNGDFQCTKWFVQRSAIEVVDKALQLSGGSGYSSGSVLSRLYRDVRAGPFMQPFSPNEAFQYIGKVKLGIDPRIE